MWYWSSFSRRLAAPSARANLPLALRRACPRGLPRLLRCFYCCIYFYFYFYFYFCCFAVFNAAGPAPLGRRTGKARLPWQPADQLYNALPEPSLTELFQVARIWFTTASGSGT